MKKVFVVIVQNDLGWSNSAHAAFSTREAAELWANDRRKNRYADSLCQDRAFAAWARWAINEVDLNPTE